MVQCAMQEMFFQAGKLTLGFKNRKSGCPTALNYIVIGLSS